MGSALLCGTPRTPVILQRRDDHRPTCAVARKTRSKRSLLSSTRAAARHANRSNFSPPTITAYVLHSGPVEQLSGHVDQQGNAEALHPRQRCSRAVKLGRLGSRCAHEAECELHPVRGREPDHHPVLDGNPAV